MKKKPIRYRLFDNGGETVDRYAAVFTGDYPGREHGYLMVTFSENPAHPQGVWMWGTVQSYRHLGKSITLDALPGPAKKCVLEEYQEILNESR